jgi:hypothetical protein
MATSPRVGSTLRHTDWLTVSCNMTLTLVLISMESSLFFNFLFNKYRAHVCLESVCMSGVAFHLPIVLYRWRTSLMLPYLLRFYRKRLKLISCWWAVFSHPNLYVYCLSLVVSLGSGHVLLVIKTRKWSEDRSKHDFCYREVLDNTLCNIEVH